MTFKFSLQDKFGLFIAAIITVFIAAISFFFYLQLTASMVERMRVEMIDTAKIIAYGLGPQAIDRAIAGGEKSKPYRELKKYLKAIQMLNYKIKNTYVMVKSNKKDVFKFVADDDFNPKTMAHLNEEYDVSKMEEIKVALLMPSVDKSIKYEKWEGWLSGYAPVFDKNSRPFAVLGIDMKASDINELFAEARDSFFLYLAIGAFFSMLLARLAAEPVAADKSMAWLLGMSTLNPEKRDALQQGNLF
jgi:sensor histidine kinase regulating citrate/malate metabolism